MKVLLLPGGEARLNCRQYTPIRSGLSNERAEACNATPTPPHKTRDNGFRNQCIGGLNGTIGPTLFYSQFIVVPRQSCWGLCLSRPLTNNVLRAILAFEYRHGELLAQRCTMKETPDWILQLIFREAEAIWEQVIGDGRSSDHAPECLHVAECVIADWDRVTCWPPVLRAWRYDRAGQRTEVAPDNAIASFEFFQRVRGSEDNARLFDAAGRFLFHFAANKKLVLIDWIVGPRYAAGWVAKISDEGPTARLEKDPSYREWVA